ncbi:PAS domain S-box protein [Methanobacterium sp.]|uniref:PAS domain S-box protein n=1 Tax=Methanobacterium sp. TaxID=2164 RepID=UPI003C742AA8
MVKSENSEKNAEEELTDKYKMLLNLISEGYFYAKVITNTEGNTIDYQYIDANDSYEKITGIKKEDILGKKATEVYPGIENDPGDWINFYGNVALTGRSAELEQYSALTDKWFHISTYSPQKGFFISIFEDITKRRQAEESLKKSEQILTDTIASITDYIYSIDQDWRFIYINEISAKKLGYKSTELIGKNIWKISPIAAGTIVEKEFRKAMYKREVRSFEWKNKYTGLYREFTVYPSIEGITVYSKDITEHKKAEIKIYELLEKTRQYAEELQVSNEELQSTTEELYASNEELQATTEELRLTNKELTESETRFRSLFESSLDAILLTMPDGNVLAANPAAQKLFGMNEEDFIKTGREGLVVHDKRLERAIRERAEKGKVFAELTHKRKDGSTFIGETSSGVFTDADGYLKTSMIIRDLTEHKKAEEALKESERLYRSIAKNFPNGVIYIFDRDLRYLVAEGQALDLVNLSSESLEGKTVYELGDEIQGYTESRFKRVLNGEKLHFETNYRGRIFSSEYIPIKNEKGIIERGMVIALDVSDLKKAEEALNRERIRLQTIIENLPVGIYIGDKNGKGIFVNEAFYKIWGTNAPIPGSIDEYREYKGWFADTGKLIEPEEWPASLALKGESVSYAADIQTFNGKKASIIISAVPIIDDKDNINGNLVVIQDITSRREMEEELRESRDNLELKVQERTIELNVLIDELKRSNEELQQFAYVSSHDLQEPLRTIANFTQLIERRYKDKLDSDADEFIDYIVDAAKRMQQLINDLLQYSRVTTKGKEFQLVNVNEVLDNVLQNLKMSIDENNTEIIVHELPTVIADDSQLIQLFQNLIGNAIKFRKPNEAPIIHISARKDENKNEYLFSVTDNGIGMEPQYAERIFTIFQRLHTRDEYEGTGIGLSIAKRIVERHGGQIWIESKYGKGSTFYFTIPFGSYENWECTS